jgi:uncharacterized ferritin-like protein (DUF455 family)
LASRSWSCGDSDRDGSCASIAAASIAAASIAAASMAAASIAAASMAAASIAAASIAAASIAAASIAAASIAAASIAAFRSRAVADPCYAARVNARDYAEHIVTSATLADKLAPPPALDEAAFEDRQPPRRIAAPGRPANLPIVPGRHARVPPLAGMRDPQQRARILHALANHELQAIELFAWAVLAFPDTPVAFRRGLLAILADEQRHLALYRDRLVAHGVDVGDLPVTGHFWNKIDHLTGPCEFVCAMNLTFENANLDFANDYATAARACGDEATATVLAQVHADEIRHVHFGWVWLRRFTADRDPWQAYLDHVRPPLGPARARGARFDEDARRRAGFDEAFIAALAAVSPTRPSGQPR